jgi:hypothetical protein
MLLDDRELELIADMLAEKLNLRRPPQFAPRLMDIPETAVYTGRSIGGVNRLISKGPLPVTKFDSKNQLDRLALDKLIAQKTELE